MSELTIALLCQALANFTHNRCSLVENSNTCRCASDAIHPISSPVVVNPAPDIMLSEVVLIFVVLAIWLSAIGFCLNQYKSLRRLETQVHYCVNRKDPLNIGEIKIVAREQDCIIYKKKRYSALLDRQIHPQDLKNMHYVQQYLPKTISTLVLNRDDLANNTPISTTTRYNSSNNISFNTHQDVLEYQSSIPYFQTEMEVNKQKGNTSIIQGTESARYTTGLTVPSISPSNSVHSSWNETSSTQHLCVPSDCYSDGNVSLPVPKTIPRNSGEQLLDPRMIPETVRRSLLALHRESQENVNLLKKKDKTRSENDVHGTLTPLKMIMKSKCKRTINQPYRPHSNTLSIFPLRTTNHDYDGRLLEYVKLPTENSSPPTSTVRRSLKYYPKYSTESEPPQGDVPLMTGIYIPSNNDEELRETIIDKSV